MSHMALRHLVDGAAAALLLAALLAITLYSKRYMRSVADFLAANRLGRRYLLAVSSGFGGAISLVAMWELTYAAGLPPQWWKMIDLPVSLFIGLTGFIVYRFRQTRCLTLAQFMELRYSRRFRYFAGFLSWLAGVLNYGIFPAVSARFIIHYFGLPATLPLGVVDIPTYPLVMAAYLSLAVYIACAGGQISIMLTDFFQGVLLLVAFFVVGLYMLGRFEWDTIMTGLQAGVPAGSSLIDPFRNKASDDFSFVFFLIMAFSAVYNARSWQGQSGYYSAALTPHEAVMSNVIGQWRFLGFWMCMLIIPLAAYTVLHLPQFSAIAAPIHAQLDQLDPQTRVQMTVPLFLANVLPVGLTALVGAMILACAISCDDTYIHGWGTILVQDVILPIRNRPLDPRRHLLWLRLSVIGVAAFAYVFSLLFPLRDYILMYFALTGAIYCGGAGAVIIGGLYWKRGTTAAAWTAMILGTVLGFGGLLVRQFWPQMTPYLGAWFPHTQWLQHYRDNFPINGQIIFLIAMLAASAAYILVSLLGPRRVHDMDRLLHRGPYALDPNQETAAEAEAEAQTADPAPSAHPWRRRLNALIGVTDRFTRGEKAIFYLSFAWTMGWWALFMVITLISFVRPFSQGFWENYWLGYVWFSMGVGAVCTVWIFLGGLRDARRLFSDLRRARVIAEDDGFVRAAESANAERRPLAGIEKK